MVVVLNGVLADDCPTSVRALLAAHPGYRDAAAQLLAVAARVVGPQGLLYVAQRELAAVVPHDSKYLLQGHVLLHVKNLGEICVFLFKTFQAKSCNRSFPDQILCYLRGLATQFY